MGTRLLMVCKEKSPIIYILFKVYTQNSQVNQPVHFLVYTHSALLKAKPMVPITWNLLVTIELKKQLSINEDY